MNIRVVVGDAIDDEPYVSSQLNPLLFLKKEAGGACGWQRKLWKPQDLLCHLQKLERSGSQDKTSQGY